VAHPARKASRQRKPEASPSPQPAMRAARPATWTLRRVILLVLLVVPLVMIVFLLRQPPPENFLLEIAFYVFGVPIVVLNLWEWASIRVLERPLPGITKK
jgi:hypothetical protein